MTARPVLGTTSQLVTDNLTAGTPFVINLLSLAEPTAAFDLAALGLPGCRQHIDLGASTASLHLVAAGAAVATLGIPNNPGFTGITIHSQSIAFTPGFNAAGLVTTNGLCLRLGL